MNKLLINRLDHFGKGIGNINDKIAFIENTLPGEVVEYKVLKTKKNYVECKAINIENISKYRVESLCPYYNECGGCNILHMSYKKQLEFKENKVKNIVYKYLSDNVKVNKIIKSDDQFNYRNKVTFQVNNKIGFYKCKSNSIVHINECILACDKINSIIPFLNKLSLNNVISITCRSNNNDLMVVLNVIGDINEKDVIEKLRYNCNSIIINKDGNFKCIYGNGYIINKIGNLKYYTTNDGFFQINNNITYKLYSYIKNVIGNKNKNLLLDLFCGSGTISLFLSDCFNKVIGIEINKSSIDCSNMNKELNNINNCNFIMDSVDNIHIKYSADVIIIDPPRGGLSTDTINKILKFNSKKIIYVSCDPMTLVRDLKYFTKKYNIDSVTPFDMFPNTYHVECICVLKLCKTL